MKLVRFDRREQVLEVPGQEVLTADSVTLRLTALGVYSVIDPVRAVTATDDAKQALYREVNLAVRVTAGARTLDALLADKESLAKDLIETVKATWFGLVRELFRDQLLGTDEWWIPDLSRRLGIGAQKFQYWVQQKWIHSRRTPSGKHVIVWGDAEDIRRLKKIATKTNSCTAARHPELVIPKKHPGDNEPSIRDDRPLEAVDSWNGTRTRTL